MHNVLHWRLKLFSWQLQLYNIWGLMTFPCCRGHAELLQRSALTKLYVSGWKHLLHRIKWTNTVCISEAVKIHMLSVSLWYGLMYSCLMGHFSSMIRHACMNFIYCSRLSICKNNFLDGGQVTLLHTHSSLNFFVHGYVKDNVHNPAVTGTDNSHQQCHFNSWSFYATIHITRNAALAHCALCDNNSPHAGT